jgi:hypothetical protein
MAPRNPQSEQDPVHSNLLRDVTAHEDEPMDDNDEADAGDDDTDDRSLSNDPVDDDDRAPTRDAPDDDDDEPDSRTRDTPTEPVVEPDDPDKGFQYGQNRRGDILDIDGKVLFPAGRPRNAWSKLKKAWNEQRDNNKALVAHAQELATVGRELFKRYNELKEKSDIGKSFALDQRETQEALELMSLAKRDPKAAVRSILTKLHLGGTDLSDIGVTGPVDAKEVARHVVELQEIDRQKRLKERQESAEESAKQEAQAFILANPDSQRYLGLITDAKYKFPHMTLDQIWSELKRSARKAAVQRRNGAGNTGQQPPAFREPPARNGSRDRRGGERLSLKAVDPSKSFKQIGAELLRDLKAMED